jgi:UDP-glucose 4-epimerase
VRILVTGGAGYIGSVLSAFLLDCDFEITILDNLSTGNQDLIDPRARFVLGDILDEDNLIDAMSDCDAVVHLAGKAIVSESIDMSDYYFSNNTQGTINVLNIMHQKKIKKFIFSSTCAVYGIPKVGAIDEKCDTSPINPYGESKLKADFAISELSRLFKLESYSFRFFNVSGSYMNSTGKNFGEMHKQETHLIPNILNSRIVTIYGSDFPTPDGTCIRDYVHVVDLAKAIKKALSIEKGSGHYIYNLGAGIGHSVLEVIKTAEEVVGSPINIKYSDARIGDPAQLVSNPSLSEIELNWKAEFSLKNMISDSYRFSKSLRAQI